VGSEELPTKEKPTMKKFTTAQRQMLAMSCNTTDGVHVVEQADKRVACRLEAIELVTIRRTTERCAGMLEWYVTATPKGRVAYTEVSQ
jgi:hypothetical protein